MTEQLLLLLKLYLIYRLFEELMGLGILIYAKVEDIQEVYTVKSSWSSIIWRFVEGILILYLILNL